MNEPATQSRRDAVPWAAAQSEPMIEALRQATAAALAEDPLDAAVIELIRRIQVESDPLGSRQQVAERLCEVVKADVVAVSMLRDGESSLVAMTDTLEHASDCEADLEVVLAEVAATGRRTEVSTNPNDPESSLAHRIASTTLRRMGAAANVHVMWTIPLLTEADEVVGAMTLVWFGRSHVQPEHQRLVNRLSGILAETLRLIDAAQPSRWSLRSAAWKAAVRSRRGRYIGIVCGCLTALGCLPIPYTVVADVTLQPRMRRVVAAPFAGSVTSLEVSAGDTVSAGDLLVVLDEDDLRTKLAAAAAERQRMLSERSGHLAAGRLGDAQVSRLAAEKAQAEIEQLERNLDRAAIRSPIDGVVMGEDLQQFTGAPLATGDALMEIAPLDSLVARLEIPPDQIMHVQAGQAVTLQMEATGFSERLQIARVAPRGEPNAHGGYTFSARANLPNVAGQWKPGMQGTAKIETDRYPAAWCLWQRVWRQIRNWTALTS